MTFRNAVTSGLVNFARFDGRSSRAELRGWLILVVGLLAAAMLLDALVAAPLRGVAPWSDPAAHPVAAVTLLALAAPTLALLNRRLHDVGRSGWWLWLLAVPVFGWAALAWWLSRPSQPRTNRHGEPAEELERL